MILECEDPGMILSCRVLVLFLSSVPVLVLVPAPPPVSKLLKMINEERA